MYALGSITKFITDNRNRIGEEKIKDMLRRAKQVSNSNVVAANKIKEILGDADLANEFHIAAQINPDHVKINTAVMQNFSNTFSKQ